MNRVIAALHTRRLRRDRARDYGKPGNYFARQIDRWSRAVQGSETEKIEAMDRLMEWLPANIPRATRPPSSTATTASTT
jgi:aminoglycoside phosphotransferase (APT) family kinase protein